MKRILFVDDDANVLKGLGHLLRKYRHQWGMVFANSGAEALAELAKAPFDVVISDMRMPGMDGAALLQKVKELYPGVARIVLSGHADRELVVRALPVSHQYLNKPCEAETLRQVIVRACELRDLLADPAMHDLVCRLDRLPSVPETYWELTRAFGNADVTTAHIAKIVERDPAMSVKVLQLVNSSYFGLARQVASITQAVSYLGLELLKGLVLTSQIFSSMERAPAIPGFSIDELQASAVIVARLAKQIIGDPKRGEEAFTAGLVHDVGKIILALGMPDKFGAAVRMASESGQPSYVVEKDVLGVTHADVGAFLMGTWGLPLPVVEAVAYHHAPAHAVAGANHVLMAVHVADVLCTEAMAPAGGVSGAESLLDMSALEALGQTSELERWRAVAGELTRSLPRAQRS